MTDRNYTCGPLHEMSGPVGRISQISDDCEIRLIGRPRSDQVRSEEKALAHVETRGSEQETLTAGEILNCVYGTIE